MDSVARLRRECHAAHVLTHSGLFRSLAVLAVLLLAGHQRAVADSPDLAQSHPATESSTYPGSPPAGVAVDGNTDGNFSDGSVTATNLEAYPWWEVDLGASPYISSIVVWNRTDCCNSRLSDYWVFVSNTPFFLSDTPIVLNSASEAGRVVFASHQTSAPSPSASIAVGKQGRYVRIQLNSANYLSLAEVQVFGGTNLALQMSASQSSTLPGTPPASVAVDGNTDGNFFDGSVTATNLEANPWWQVDLGASATIDSIVIWNRTDCCGSRLSDYWVFVSDTPFLATDTPTTLLGRGPGTFSFHETTAPNPSTVISPPAPCTGPGICPDFIVAPPVGRYVRVQLSSPNYLSLAEVQLIGTGGSVNLDLAQGKAASQSSTLPGTPLPSVAVDGNTDGNFSDGSVTATNLEANPWWQVDLGTSATISSIVIWNRTDCCGSRLSDYWVFVSDTPFLAIDTPATLQARTGTYSFHETTAPNPSTTISTPFCTGTTICPFVIVAPPVGRYVRVQLNSPNYLSLAEVQVFGTPGSAPAMVASESSQLPGSPPASAAIDGNTDGDYSHGSVTATNLENYPWWQVDLGASTSIGWILVWNRTDCCGSRLSDYWVYVSNTPFALSDTPITLAGNPNVVFSSHQTTAPNPMTAIPVPVEGRYVRIQLSGPNNGLGYLSLAEVHMQQIW